MSHLATVLAAIASGPTAQTLLELLERKGYRGFLVHGRAEAEAVIRDRQPDLILIGPSLADADGLDFARALKADPVTAGVPLFLLAEELNESFCRSALDIGVEDAMRLPIDEGALLARMRTLARITTMHTELRLRAAVARGMGIAVRDEVSAPPADGAPSLMMLGRPENRDFLREALGDGAEIVATNDPFEADALVEGRMFDAAVLFADGSPASCLDLCAHMRNNVRLFNLPV
ncbi:MAG: hypothetical protein HQL33_12765, partial [Alphaproteobacteria bacterium]|nr:hypothetical protein [Alphaproteobacteria bacterium]